MDEHPSLMPAFVLPFRPVLMLRSLFCLLLAVPFVRAQAPGEPVHLILDTDIGNDVDDALALAMIHAFESRGEVRLLAVTVTKDNLYAPAFVDFVNAFYGRPNIPIGVVHNGKTPEDSAMLKVAPLRPDRTYPEAVELLTRVLSGEPNGAVTIAQIGFSTNLARLVASAAGRRLVQEKVKTLYLMAGNFVQPKPEYNVATDADSFRALMEHWPTPIIFSGFEIGLEIPFPYQAILKDFRYTSRHPIVEAYKTYVGKVADRPNWDSTAVLEAVRPDRDYFAFSAPGRVTLGPKNTTVFKPDPKGNCRYLILKPDRAAAIRELIATLVSEPPQRASK
jgi:inosine-uridine nucleoside N-ribohydrolase